MSEMPTSIGIVGTLVRVIEVDLDNQTIHFQLPDGRTGRASGLTGLDSTNPGDVLVLGDAGWEQVPNSIWRESNSITTVRKLLDDGGVLVDSGVGFERISNVRDVEVKVGNMIEYSHALGVLRVISERPIKSGIFASDADNIEAEFLVDKDGGGPTFADFGGYPGVVARAKELIETQLERREQLDKIGARPVKGILFTGLPGTGKTHLARIIAKESKADFYLVSGPSVVSKWVGDTEDTLRRIFVAAKASSSGRAIIFFDEIDSLAERRSGDSHEASKRLVGQLLALMDGFDTKSSNVIVIAATNRVEVLDPALTRPGRFDWEIEFGLPTLQDRFEILKVRAGQLSTVGELPLEDLAALTDGWSAAELTAIWTEAALVGAGDGREFIAAEDVAQAFERILARPRRQANAEATS